MASYPGFISASKEVVLEIQLNKIVNDFLFSGVENRNTTGVPNAEGLDDSRPVSSSNDGPSRNGKSPSWRMDSPSYISVENGNLSEDMSNLAHPCSVTEIHCSILANAPREMREGSKCTPSIQSKEASLPSLEEIRLDMPEQKSNTCNEDMPQRTNELKAFHLSRAHSVAGSLSCFAMERREQRGERKQEDKNFKQEKGNIKLTRTGSLPCHSELLTAAEKEVKHTCRKPPRPPRPSSVKGPCPLLSRLASDDAIFVLHGASKRARLEKRKKHAASSSSNASMWALIFTFCFAMAMIGEGFWSQSSAIPTVDTSINSTAALSHINLNRLPSSLKMPAQENLRVSSQLEQEMRMREFWISKGLDTS